MRISLRVQRSCALQMRRNFQSMTEGKHNRSQSSAKIKEVSFAMDPSTLAGVEATGGVNRTYSLMKSRVELKIIKKRAFHATPLVFG